MRIGLILHPYGEKNPSGLGRSIEEIARAIIECSPEDEFVLFTKGNIKKRHNFPGTNWTMQPLPASRWWLEWHLRHAPKMDAYLFFTPVMPLTWTPQNATVIVHDYDYNLFSAATLRNLIVNAVLPVIHRHTLQRAAHIVVPSEATKLSVTKALSITPDRITVIPHGANDVCCEGDAVVEVPKRFFLFVGVIKPRKNIERIVQAFSAHVRKHPETHLLLAGKYSEEYRDQILSAVKDASIHDRIHFLGFISNKELCFLYKHALALISPSLAEGFGMTVLEAMLQGLPVITSNRGALQESAGDAAVLVDPEDTESITQAVELLEDLTQREQLIRKGQKHVGAYTWQRTALRYRDQFRAQ